MELTLNLVWLCVAIAGVCVQIITSARAKETSRRDEDSSRKIVAMACALVILFFVISMTDDLHDQEVMLEESKSSRVTVTARVSAASDAGRLASSHFLERVVPAFSTEQRPQPVFGRFAECPVFLPVLEAMRDSFVGRAPPLPLA